MERLESEMKDINSNSEALKRNFLDLTELRHILSKTHNFFAEVSISQFVTSNSLLHIRHLTIALIVAGMDSLKDRHEMLMARFFKRQVLASDVLLHYLLPERHDNDTIRSLRNSQTFPSIRVRTNKFYKSFLPYCLKNFT